MVRGTSGIFIRYITCELLPQHQSLVGKMQSLFEGLTDFHERGRYHCKASISAVNLRLKC
jgi:hypothetical protein